MWMLALAFIILKGWGDGLIAGYNTASNEKRELYDIKRLRKVVAALLLFVTAAVWLPAWLDSSVFILILIIGIVVGIIIANTWCKTK